MRALILILTALFATNTFAAAIPFSPKLDSELRKLNVKKTLKVVYNPGANSDLGSTSVDSGVHGLGKYLPQGAIITRSFIHVASSIVANAGTVVTLAFHCEDASNIKTATAVGNTGSGSWDIGYIEGASTGTAATFKGSIAAPCEIKATVNNPSPATGQYISSGRAALFIEYVIGQE